MWPLRSNTRWRAEISHRSCGGNCQRVGLVDHDRSCPGVERGVLDAWHDARPAWFCFGVVRWACGLVPEVPVSTPPICSCTASRDLHFFWAARRGVNPEKCCRCAAFAYRHGTICRLVCLRSGLSAGCRSVTCSGWCACRGSYRDGAGRVGWGSRLQAHVRCAGLGVPAWSSGCGVVWDRRSIGRISGGYGVTRW